MEREERASGNTHSNYLIDNRMEKKYIALFWWRAKPPILLLINFNVYWKSSGDNSPAYAVFCASPRWG